MTNTAVTESRSGEIEYSVYTATIGDGIGDWVCAIDHTGRVFEVGGCNRSYKTTTTRIDSCEQSKTYTI